MSTLQFLKHSREANLPSVFIFSIPAVRMVSTHTSVLLTLLFREKKICDKSNLKKEGFISSLIASC